MDYKKLYLLNRVRREQVKLFHRKFASSCDDEVDERLGGIKKEMIDLLEDEMAKLICEMADEIRGRTTVVCDKHNKTAYKRVY